MPWQALREQVRHGEPHRCEYVTDLAAAEVVDQNTTIVELADRE
jgi:hypothetical protein